MTAKRTKEIVDFFLISPKYPEDKIFMDLDCEREEYLEELEWKEKRNLLSTAELMALPTIRAKYRPPIPGDAIVAEMRDLEAHGQQRLYKCYGKTCIRQANGENECQWSESSTPPIGPPSRPK